MRDELKKFIRAKDEIAAQLQVAIKRYPEPKKKFILISAGRCGSEVLRGMINLHPDIYCDKEIYLKRKAYAPKKFLENRSKIYGKKIYGHKSKIAQLDEQYEDKEKVKEVFLSDDYQIIYLRRKNFFRQALSGIISNQRKKKHDTKAAPLKGYKFKIGPKHLMKKIRWIEKCERREKEILDGLQYLTIYYEDDLLPQENHQHTLDKVFQYLGVDSVNVHAKFKKTLPKKISDFIDNHAEITHKLKNTKYAIYLDD